MASAFLSCANRYPNRATAPRLIPTFCSNKRPLRVQPGQGEKVKGGRSLRGLLDLKDLFNRKGVGGAAKGSKQLWEGYKGTWSRDQCSEDQAIANTFSVPRSQAQLLTNRGRHDREAVDDKPHRPERRFCLPPEPYVDLASPGGTILLIWFTGAVEKTAHATPRPGSSTSSRPAQAVHTGRYDKPRIASEGILCVRSNVEAPPPCPSACNAWEDLIPGPQRRADTVKPTAQALLCPALSRQTRAPPCARGNSSRHPSRYFDCRSLCRKQGFHCFAPSGSLK